MQSIRRVYLYAVAFVSLEVIVWGLIGLGRSIFSGSEIGGGASRLAGALSLVLVGAPVFWLHWWLAQRSARQDSEERFSRVRAAFLYGVLLATLVPVIQNFLALVSRLLYTAFGLPAWQALLGGDQTASDNLIAMAANLLVAAYMYTVLRADWAAAPVGDEFPETRRLYRYAWLLYALVFVVFGVQQILLYILSSLPSLGAGVSSLLANGLALLLAGLPVWILSGRIIQNSLAGDPKEQDDPKKRDSAERRSILRLVVLYILSFISVAVILVSAVLVLQDLLRVILGDRPRLANFLAGIASPLSIAVPLGVVWAFYGKILNREMSGQTELVSSVEPTLVAGKGASQRRRAGLRRLYFYVLSLFGVGAAFAGLQLLLGFILEAAVGAGLMAAGFLRGQLAYAFSFLAVGLPLWTFAWRPMQLEASKEGEPGDHARRSAVRKGYLFLILFVAVLGVMFAAGSLLYSLLRAALGDAPPNLNLDALEQLKILLLFGLLLAYHWFTLRSDNRMAERSLARRHAIFPVLVMAPDGVEPGGNSASGADFATGFAATLVEAIQREAPSMPVAVHPFNQGVPDETLSTARAVILPGELLSRPSEANRLWLQTFTGARLVIPTPSKGWHWIFGRGKSLPSLARQAAQLVRRLAEGDEVSSLRDVSPWMVLVYILAGLFLVEIILAVLGIGASLILR